MRRIALVGLILTGFYGVWGQTNSNSTGNWSDVSIWSTLAVPLQTATVNVNHSVTIDQNITVTTGTFNFGATGGSDENITDITGGTAYTLTATTAGGTINILDGLTWIEGAAFFDNSTITIAAGATLIIGPTGGTGNILTIDNGTTFTVNGTLIVNGNFVNNNNGSGILTINSGGLVQVNGNYNANSVGAVDINGAGDLFATGTILTQGSSDVFGSTNDCATGPCSGRNLCGYTLSVSSNQAVCNSAAINASTPTVLTRTTNATGTLTYTWQRAGAAGGFSNATSGTPPVPTAGLAAGTNTNSTYTIDPSYYNASEVNYFRLYMYDSNTGCGAFSPSVVLVSVSSSGWLGTTNNWHTTSNWCNNTVPTLATPNLVEIEEFPTGTGKFYPVISTADANVRALTINSAGLVSASAAVTLSGTNTLNIAGNFTNNGTFTASTTSTVTFTNNGVAARTNTIGGTTATTFGNLTLNNSGTTLPSIIFDGNNKVVAGALTLTSGIVDLAGFTVTVGTSAASTGSLSRSAGWLYGGFIQRYFGTGATTLANGLFPMGNSTTDYRPFSVGYTSGLTTGGYVRLSHTGTQFTSSNVSFFDNPPTNTVTVLRRSGSFWTSTRNGITGGGTSFQLEAGGTSFSNPATLTDFRLILSGSVVGSNGTSSGAALDPLIQRTGLSAADLANTFYVGSINLATPLPVTLSEFDAYLTKEGVALNWSTLTEVNADYFEIEKSTNGYDFRAIGRMSAHGTSSSKIDYSFLDQNTLFSKAYYRLKSTDVAIGTASAAFEYSKVISVEKSGFQNYGVMVYPNPVENKSFTIQVGDGNPMEGQVMLCDLSGRTISKELRNNVQGEYQISDNLQSGFYLLKVYTSTIRQTVKVIVK